MIHVLLADVDAKADAMIPFVPAHIARVLKDRIFVLYGKETLKIPGTNLGPLPSAGGVPQFQFSGGLNSWGANYPALTYAYSLLKNSASFRVAGKVALASSCV